MVQAAHLAAPLTRSTRPAAGQSPGAAAAAAPAAGLPRAPHRRRGWPPLAAAEGGAEGGSNADTVPRERRRRRCRRRAAAGPCSRRYGATSARVASRGPAGALGRWVGSLTSAGAGASGSTTLIVTCIALLCLIRTHRTDCRASGRAPKSTWPATFSGRHLLCRAFHPHPCIPPALSSQPGRRPSPRAAEVHVLAPVQPRARHARQPMGRPAARAAAHHHPCGDAQPACHRRRGPVPFRRIAAVAATSSPPPARHGRLLPVVEGRCSRRSAVACLATLLPAPAWGGASAGGLAVPPAPGRAAH